jgi:hypothetical protein
MEKRLLECSHCGCEMDEEQSAAPRRDDCGDPMCDSCWTDKYEFTCCWCGEYEHIDEQHEVLVVFEECGGLTAGIYRINEGPYWTSDFFTMWFNLRALTHLGNLPGALIARHKRDDEYPCGHLCRNCRDRLVFPRLWGVPEVPFVNAARVGAGR